MTTPTTTIDLSYNTEGQVTHTRRTHSTPTAVLTLDGIYRPFLRLTEATVNGRSVRLPLMEAVLSQPDAANILRQDLRLLAFTALANNPRSFEAFTWFQDSNKPQEEYLRDAAMGVLSKAPSGEPAPIAQSAFEGGTIVKNYLYRKLVEIPGDFIRFDQIGKVRQIALEMGLSARLTEESEVYSYITTAGNYTRNSTTLDNDVGANTAATTFSADGLRTAQTTISTSKDRKSGAYLGYNADTLICGPQLEVPVLQLLMSPVLQRQHGSTTVETIGTGTNNPFSGIIRRVIVSPWFGTSYQWALCDSTRNSFVFQTVEPFNVFQETQNVTSESWLTLDVIRYLVRGYFGLGFVDDRAWYYSSAVTDATVS